MSSDSVSLLLNIGSIVAVVFLITCFAVLGYFLYRYPTLKAQYEAEQGILRERQTSNHPTSETRFESYKKHLEAFKNKPIL